MKQIIKLSVCLLIGIVAGLFIGGIIAVQFTDTTFGEFLGKLASAHVVELVGAAAVGMVSFIVAIAVLIL